MPDGTIIQLSLEAAGTIGTTLAIGIAGAAKILVGYLSSRDQKMVEESKELRAQAQSVTDSLLDIQKDSLETTTALTVAVNKLSDRLDSTSLHEPRQSSRKN
jgi:hypothetical protein